MLGSRTDWPHHWWVDTQLHVNGGKHAHYINEALVGFNLIISSIFGPIPVQELYKACLFKILTFWVWKTLNILSLPGVSSPTCTVTSHILHSQHNKVWIQMLSGSCWSRSGDGCHPWHRNDWNPRRLLPWGAAQENYSSPSTHPILWCQTSHVWSKSLVLFRQVWKIHEDRSSGSHLPTALWKSGFESLTISSWSF